MLNQNDLKQLNNLIAEGKADRFYHWSKWETLRREVLKLDRFECQICKANGRYRKATIVHHVKHLQDRPDLALSIWDGKERQLVSVCKRCHEDLHPDHLKKRKSKRMSDPVRIERWD